MSFNGKLPGKQILVFKIVFLFSAYNKDNPELLNGYYDVRSALEYNIMKKVSDTVLQTR